MHNSPSELDKLLASDLISARRAAVLAYIASLLLRTIPIVHSELDANSSNATHIDVEFGDLPRPNRQQSGAIPAESSHSSCTFHGTSGPPWAYLYSTTRDVSLRAEEVCR